MRTLVAATCFLVLAALFRSAPAYAGPPYAEGNPLQGRVLIGRFGCGACHLIPGISGADSDVGPPLTRIGRRIYVAGMLRNTPDNLAYWIQHPQQVVPGNAMPDMGISRRQAQDIAAYLLTLR